MAEHFTRIRPSDPQHITTAASRCRPGPTRPVIVAEHDDDEGGVFHVGRRHVTDIAGEPMVLDWRAPISRKFYQASVKEPQDVNARRRFGFVKGELTSFEDENLQSGQEPGTSRILLEEIERPRVGPMRDIVATTQPEQDELVRAELDESICVQGGTRHREPQPQKLTHFQSGSQFVQRQRQEADWLEWGVCTIMHSCAMVHVRAHWGRVGTYVHM